MGATGSQIISLFSQRCSPSLQLLDSLRALFKCYSQSWNLFLPGIFRWFYCDYETSFCVPSNFCSIPTIYKMALLWA